MKEDTKETAVELLSEWKSRKEDIEVIKFFGNLDGNDLRNIEFLEKETDGLSRRLDEMCEAAGISIVDNEFAYNSDKTEWRLLSDGGHLFINLPAREQQALQEWLLIKEGGNNA